MKYLVRLFSRGSLSLQPTFISCFLIQFFSLGFRFELFRVNVANDQEAPTF
jgi:hypothetical protein